MNTKSVFVCELPPPYGGVTVKNQLIVKQLKAMDIQVDVIDLCECKRGIKKCIITLVKLLIAYVTRDKIVYGFGSYKRLKLALALQRMISGKKCMAKAINIVMGGSLPECLKKDSTYTKLLTYVGCHWVETEGMKNELGKYGIKNVLVFPNPKPECGSCVPKENSHDRIKLVYFSQINVFKGVRDIIVLVNKLIEKKIDFSIDFYGPVAHEFKEEFFSFVNSNDMVFYNGVFDSTKESVYSELNKYDVLLFPTRWEGEGVPGILIEAKMSGLAVIASDHAYNSELICVKDFEGYLIYDDFPAEMLEIVEKLNDDRRLLFRIKEHSFNSRKRYSLEEYSDYFVSFIQ